MKKIYFLLSIFIISQTFAGEPVRIATFDSGFGGFFTAKEIELQSKDLQRSYDANFIINHYGDTANAPYGEKTPEQIAKFSSLGIKKAFSDGAEVVFIACNTASTQFEAIKALLEKEKPGQGDRIVSIIESSVTELKRQIDSRLAHKKVVNVVILATPATIKANAYIRALGKAYNVLPEQGPTSTFTQSRWRKVKSDSVDSAVSTATLTLPSTKKILVHSVGPGNWVEMIEHGASAFDKKSYIAKDLALLAPKVKWDVVGEFCTHFPAVDTLIKSEAERLKLSDSSTSYIRQGPLMADIFRKMMVTKLTKRKEPLKSAPDVRAQIFISGENIQETKDLAKEVYPLDPIPEVSRIISE